MFTDEFRGFNLPSVTLRDPQIRAGDDPLTAKLVKTTPLLEGLEIDGRIAVILSPYDISCALEKGATHGLQGLHPRRRRPHRLERAAVRFAAVEGDREYRRQGTGGRGQETGF